MPIHSNNKESLAVIAAERKRKIQAIAEFPAILDEAVRGLTAAQLDTQYKTGGWTLRQVVHHLADSHMNLYVRVKLILTEKHPTLKTYDQDAWALTADSKLPIDLSLTILRGVHARLAALLASMRDDAWSRTAHHPDNGTMTVDDFLAMIARHCETHLSHINGLKKETGW